MWAKGTPPCRAMKLRVEDGAPDSWRGASGLSDGGEVVGGALKDGDLAIEAAKLLISERQGWIC